MSRKAPRADRPQCPDCGSLDLILPGHTSFRWSRGRWVEMPGASIADGAPLHCQGCGETWMMDSLEPPFVLVRDGAAFAEGVYKT